MQQDSEQPHNSEKRLTERSVSQAALVTTTSSKQLFKLRNRKSFDVLRRSSSDISDLDLSLDIVDSGFSENDSQLHSRHEEHSESIKTVSRLKRSISGKFRYNSKISVETTTVVSNDGFHKHIRQGISVKSLHKLLKRVSDINATDSKGQSALHVCASRGMIDCAKLLIKKGSNVNLQDNTGFTPLHCGALERQIGSCRLLLEARGIDVTITTNENANVLHYLVRNPVDEENVVMYRRVLDLLVEKGLDINKGNMHDEAPIHFSCMKGNTHTCAFLLERGANCNLRTAVGETPLHYAIRSGSLKLVRMLMENGADPTALGEDNATPLEVAEQYQNTDVLDCLQAIIEEELVTEVNSSLMSPRVRINEATIHQEGWLDVYCDNDWCKLFVVVNNQRMICYQNYTKNLQIKFSIRLTKSSVFREDVLRKEGEPDRWRFIVRQTNCGSGFLFAVETEELLNEWVQPIENVLAYREELCKLYDKLKALSKPRESLRLKERKLAHKYFIEGSEKLLSLSSPLKLGRWITGNIEVAASSLSETVNIDDEGFIRSMVRYFLEREIFVKFMKACITHEIRKTTMGETLFREMSLATRMLSSFLDMEEGRQYLQNTVLGLINSITASCQEQGLEINPYLCGDSHKLKFHLEKILEISQIFLDKVLSSATSCPL